MPDSIHQEVLFQASAEKIYRALTTADQFNQVIGGAHTQIDATVGGLFSLFDSRVVGSMVELIPYERIVQQWRLIYWEEGLYSVAKFELKPQGDATLLVFDHQGFPPEGREQLDSGWHKMYWDPLKRFLAQP